MIKIWKNAIGALHNCGHIYIIGFSLSPFDTMARLLFGGVMMERSKKKDVCLPKITLIDPNAEEKEFKSNFKNVFGNSASINTIGKKGEEVDWSALLEGKVK